MKSLFLFFAFMLSCSIAFSQDTGEEVYPKQASIEHNEAVKSFSKDFVSAFFGPFSVDKLGLSADGLSNYAATNIYGSENMTILSQHGYGLTGIINIMGDYNKANLDQRGTDLMSTINIEGVHNILDLQQTGIGLSNEINVLGSGLEFDVMHTNMGFQLNQRGIGAIPLSIQHTGRTIPILIQNN